jgi:ATP-dependent helicase/nuclease subunit A
MFFRIPERPSSCHAPRNGAPPNTNMPTTFPHLMIRASAGTGKTFQLTNRYLSLIDGDAGCDQVLATTFTRKAAGEILDRVLSRLATAADSGQHCGELAQFVGDGSLTPARALELLARLVRNLHRLRISTLDSFFAQIAVTFSLELGLPPGWRIVEESTDARLRTEAIQAVLGGGAPGDTLALLHLLTKGEATRTVSEQVRSLVNSLHGLYLEAPPDAWKQVPRPTPLAQEKLAAALDGLAAFSLSGKQLPNARDKDLEAARAADWATFVAKGIGKCVLDGKPKFGSQTLDPRLIEIYHALGRHARAVLLTQLAGQTEATCQVLEKFDGHYRRLKLAHRALRFDDITRGLGSSALMARVGELAHRLDAGIDHLLLDEFQDTSLAQWEVLRPFADQVMPAGSFFCVGDVKQAIYGWRGGVAELFDTLETAWPKLRRSSLATSFRSSPPIIETVNRVFDRLENLAPLADRAAAVRAWKAGFEQHSTTLANLAGYARMVVAPRAEDPTPQAEVTLAFAAEEIKRFTKEAPGRSVGVLVRDNQAVARLIYELRQREVPASEEGGNPLTDSPAVGTVLSLLTLADHPGNLVARFHVASSPLGPIAGLTDYQSDSAARRISLDVRRSLLTRGYGATLYRWARSLADSCDDREANRLLQLVELAYRYEPEATLRVRDFVAFVEGQRVEDPAATDVRVMTIHQAKGLEFDIVVLPRLDARFIGQSPPVVIGREWPTGPVNLICRYVNADVRALLPEEFQRAFERQDEQALRESLCVLYVALTRAVHALHIIVSPSKENEKNMPKSHAGILRAALAEGASAVPGAVLYEHGDPRWFEKERHKPGAKCAADAKEKNAHAGRREFTPTGRVSTNGAAENGAADNGALEAESQFAIALAPLGDRRRRGLRRESPSELARGARVDVALRLQLKRSEATTRGSAFHAWFERIEWLDDLKDGEPADAVLRQAAASIDASPRQISTWLGQFRRLLGQPEVRAALSRDAYLNASTAPWRHDAPLRDALATGLITLDVERERSFAVRHDDRLLTGAIDRLVLVRCAPRGTGGPGPLMAAEILDFKTDTISGDPADGLVQLTERYAPQLDAYRRSVAQLTGLPLDRVFARLLPVGLEA